jgi:hypothetical protein
MYAAAILALGKIQKSVTNVSHCVIHPVSMVSAQHPICVHVILDISDLLQTPIYAYPPVLQDV